MLAIVQARMSSKRLPGKVLMPVKGQPMLLWLIEKLRHCEMISNYVIATSCHSSDDLIASFCHDHSIRIVRGELDDVVKRFLMAGREMAVSEFVRVNGDSPLMDPKLIDQAVTIYKQNKVDLVTNVHPRSYPKGQSVEIIRVDALEELSHSTQAIEDREHVTSYFYRHAGQYRIRNFNCERNLSRIQLSVDSSEDFRAFELLAEAMTRPHWTYSYSELADMKSHFHAKDLGT